MILSPKSAWPRPTRSSPSASKTSPAIASTDLTDSLLLEPACSGTVNGSDADGSADLLRALKTLLCDVVSLTSQDVRFD
jgi:hypothetical protein